MERLHFTVLAFTVAFTVFYVGIYGDLCMCFCKTLYTRAARGGGGSFKIRTRIGEIGCCEARMTKQKHWWIELTVQLCDWLTAELSIWLTD